MIKKIGNATRRIRRTMAQHGLRGVAANIWRRARTGNFAPTRPLVLEAKHPFDELAGIDTGGFIHGSKLNTGHPHDVYNVVYYGTAPSLVRGTLDRWLDTPDRKPIEDYTFIDFGSGKGRVVLIASGRPFLQCIGVELNPELNAIARQNIEKWQKRGNAVTPLRSVCQDATEFQFPPTPCLIYLFNPFTGRVLELLIDHIARTFADRPGEVDILYLNPDFGYLFEQHPGFARLWHARIGMSEEDAAADVLHLVEETGERRPGEAIQFPLTTWRWVGNPPAAGSPL